MVAMSKLVLGVVALLVVATGVPAALIAPGPSRMPFPASLCHSALFSSSIVSMATLSLFTTLDKTCTGSLWGWLGALREANRVSTSEPARKGRFLVHFLNAHSSVAHIMAGAFVLHFVSHDLEQFS